jgi:hypothetical protein
VIAEARRRARRIDADQPPHGTPRSWKLLSADERKPGRTRPNEAAKRGAPAPAGARSAPASAPAPSLAAQPYFSAKPYHSQNGNNPPAQPQLQVGRGLLVPFRRPGLGHKRQSALSRREITSCATMHRQSPPQCGSRLTSSSPDLLKHHRRVWAQPKGGLMPSQGSKGRSHTIDPHSVSIAPRAPVENVRTHGHFPSLRFFHHTHTPY